MVKANGQRAPGAWDQGLEQGSGLQEINSMTICLFSLSSGLLNIPLESKEGDQRNPKFDLKKAASPLTWEVLGKEFLPCLFTIGMPEGGRTNDVLLALAQFWGDGCSEAVWNGNVSQQKEKY